MEKQKEKVERKGKKKFVWSIILFVLSLVALGFAIYCFLYVGDYDGREQSNLVQNAIFFLVATLILMGISCYLNWSYRSDNEKPGVFSLILFIITIIPTGIIFVILWLIIKFVIEWKKHPSSPPSSKSKKETWVVNKNGYDRTLEKKEGTSYIDGKRCQEYRDDLGNTWYSDDDGKSFFEK